MSPRPDRRTDQVDRAELASEVVFTIEQRDALLDRVLGLGLEDERVVAGAVVGSLAVDAGDRFSDVDLTFGVADGAQVADVLDDWTRLLIDELDAVPLVDLERGPTAYRVFLLPDALQLDVRVLLQVVVPDGMLRSAALRRDHCIDAVMFHAHQGGLADLPGLGTDRGNHDDRTAPEVATLLAVRRLEELGLLARPRRRAGLVVTLERHDPMFP